MEMEMEMELELRNSKRRMRKNECFWYSTGLDWFGNGIVVIGIDGVYGRMLSVQNQ